MMNDEDLKNDAIDAQIQRAIGLSRGQTLQGMAEPVGVTELAPEGSDLEITEMMQAQDDEEEAKKKQGGGGMGGMLSSVAGMIGG